MRQQSARVARYNRAVVLDLIRRHGPVSKSDLAERTGLAVSSVLNILASLSRRGLIRSVGTGPSTGGRPPSLVELNPAAHYAIGVNIRVKVVEAVLLDLAGDIHVETVLPLQGGSNPDAVVATVVESVEQLLRLGHVDAGRVLGAGVGCPGPVTHNGFISGTPGFPSWSQVRLKERLEERLGLPVTLENDANLGALAEYRYGIGARRPGGDSLVYIFADHGIGQGIVIDGKVFRGANGHAGELGHTVIDVDGAQCECGNYGCLETMASVGSVVSRVVRAAKLGGSTLLEDSIRGDWDAVSYLAVVEAIQAGDTIAISALDEAMSYLAIGVLNVMRQFGPEVIVLGGQLFDSGSDAHDRLLTSLKNRPSFYGLQPPPIVLGDLGTRAPSVGGAALVLENFFGVPEQAMSLDQSSTAREPAFEDTPVWPHRAEAGVLFTPGKVRILSATNLQPQFARLGPQEPLRVTVDIEVAGDAAECADDVKALLHWDRVPLFGGHWPSPKNSPMRVLQTSGSIATFGVTLGSLPPGKYEFAAHVLGSNDVWVRTETQNEINGRIEVMQSRAVPWTDPKPTEDSGKHQMLRTTK